MVIDDPQLFQEWKQELVEMSARIQNMRKLLYEALVSRKTPGDWSHITKQIGMFSFTGLNAKQVSDVQWICCFVWNNKR